MNRDFTETTREKLNNILEYKDNLFSDDIGIWNPFNCIKISVEDLKSCTSDISSCISSANSIITKIQTESDSCKEKLDSVFDSVLVLDDEYPVKIEDDTVLFLENYLNDLSTLVEALSVSGLNYEGKTLDELDKDSIFADGSFADKLKNVDNPFVDEIYNDLIRYDTYGNPYVDKNKYRELMMREGYLEIWEMDALIKIFNEVYIDENGNLDNEAFGNFLEMNYTYPIVGDDTELLEYELFDKYSQFVEYYNSYVNSLTYTDDDRYNVMAKINGILIGVDQNYSYISNDGGYYYDEEYDGYKPYNFNFTLANYENYTEVSLQGNNLNEIKVYSHDEYSNVRTSINKNNAIEKKDAATDAYVSTYNKGWANYIIKKAKDVVGKEYLGDKYKKLKFFLDIANIGNDADEAHSQQLEEIAKYDTIINEEIFNDIQDRSSGYGAKTYMTVIEYGDNLTTINYNINEDELDRSVELYNSKIQERINKGETGLHQITPEDVMKALYYPTEENYEYIYDYLSYNIN